jgi:DnaJ-class molecular chaperone
MAFQTVSDLNTHYAVLGLQPGASLEEVKRAYRRLMNEFHPDHNPRGLERTKAINLAHDAILKAEITGIHTATSSRPEKKAPQSERRSWNLSNMHDTMVAADEVTGDLAGMADLLDAERAFIRATAIR